MPIYEIAGRENVNVAQLTLNISFAALAAALAFNLSRRAIFWIAATFGVGVVALVGLSAYHEQMRSGAEREERMANDAVLNGNFDAAKHHLLKASNYWWWKGWSEGGRRDSERAFDEQAMKKEAAFWHAKRDEERAGALLEFDYWKDTPARDEGVTEARRLLIQASENWHIAGRFEDEERVREWAARTKRYISIDPNAGRDLEPPK